MYDVIVLGAGAAGLFCAGVAGQRGRRVLVLDHNPKPGAKILISGGGRANFTNLHCTAANFLSANPHFAKAALARFGPGEFLDYIRRHRIPYHEKTLGQLFCDRSAQDLLNMLLEECRRGAVELKLDTRIDSVSKDTLFRLETSRGPLEATSVVVATGGLSIPKLGATGFGYDLARRFGLQVVPPEPALVPLVVPGCAPLAGVSTEVEASLGRTRFREKMLFTHRGVSGPALLQISSYWKKGEPVALDLLPGVNLAEWPAHEAKQRLSRALPTRLAEWWLETEGFSQPVPSLKKMDARAHRWELLPEGTEGFGKAEVTRGGVATGELSSKTMEARKVPGLFFIGEVTDVTGHLGGFNFQWAWSSGFAAAEALSS